MYEVLQNLYRIYRSKRFIFMGGGTCNEEVDQVAKRSLKCNVSLSKTEVKDGQRTFTLFHCSK